MQGAELLRALVGGAYPAREQDHRVGERGLPPGLTFEDMAGGLVTFSIRKWGAAPLKKRLGYRETASMGPS